MIEKEQRKAVSVIIPMFNAEKYLDKCVICLNNQSYKDFEVIFVNDGSTDGTLSLIISKSHKFEFSYKLISTENKGVASARNTGLEAAEGEYIVFIDADDYLEQDYLKDMYTSILLNNAECAVCGWKKVNEQQDILSVSYIPENRYINKSDKKTVLEQMEVGRFDPQIWCTMLKRDMLTHNQIRFTDGCRYGEDSEFIQKALLYSQSAVHTGTRGYYYVVRSSSCNKKKVGLQRLDSLHAFKRLLSYINEKGIIFDDRILTKMYTRKILYLVKCFIKEQDAGLYYQLINDDANRQIIFRELSSTTSKKQKINILMLLKFPKIYYFTYNILYSGYLHFYIRAGA